MNYLIDTHLLIWAAGVQNRVPEAAWPILNDPDTTLYVSAAALWEIAIKHALARPDFSADPTVLRGHLRREGIIELPINGEHALLAGALPPIHKDPFDRIMIAQAMVEGLTLLTSDAKVADYEGPILRV